jgi:tetratricopeptide (TPR) repeat protein
MLFIKALIDSFAGDLAQAEAGLRDVRAMGPMTDGVVQAISPIEAGVYAFDGRARKALAIVERGRPAIYPSYTASLLEFGFVAALLIGDLDAAGEYATEGYRLGEEYGAWTRALVTFGAWRASVCRLRGRLDDALRLCREAAVRLPERSVYAGVCLGELAHALALRGDAPAARDALRSAAEMSVSSGHSVVFPPMLARTWVLAAHGDLTEARKHALDTASRAAARKLRSYEATALHDLVRLGAPTWPPHAWPRWPPRSTARYWTCSPGTRRPASRRTARPWTSRPPISSHST